MSEVNNVLILDIQTSDLSKFGKIIDAGWCIYDIKRKSVKASGSTYFKTEENKLYTINNIDIKYTNGCTRNVPAFFNFPVKHYKYDFVLGYHASFIKKFLDAENIRLKKPWICAKNDIQWPFNSDNIYILAVKLGVKIINGTRSIDTCNIIADCLSKIESPEDAINNAREPYEFFYIDLDDDDYTQAKEMGFNYDKEKKLWYKKIKTKDKGKLNCKLNQLNI